MAEDHKIDENWLVSKIGDALESMYNSGKKLTSCEKPGHTFGVKIDWNGISITECGCYSEAVWPAALSAGVGPLATKLGRAGGRRIAKYLQKTAIGKAANLWKNIVRKNLDDMILNIKKQVSMFRIWKEWNGPSAVKGFYKQWAQLWPTPKLYEEAVSKLDELLNGYIDDIKHYVDGTEIVHRRAGIDDEWADISDLAAEILLEDPNGRSPLDILKEIGERDDAAAAAGKLFDASLPDEVIVEALAKNPELRSEILKSIQQTTKEFYNQAAALLPEGLDPGDLGAFQDLAEAWKTGGGVITQIENVFKENLSERSYLSVLGGYMGGLLTFVVGILSYLTIVVDKECSPLIVDSTYKLNYEGPMDHRLSSGMQDRLVRIIDGVFFQGRWRGGSWDGSVFFPTFRSGECNVDSSIQQALGSNPSWNNIKEILIEKKLPVWPDLDDKCECSTCPSGYSLCSWSSVLNFGSNLYNICLPICGGQEAKPLSNIDLITKSNCSIGCPDGYMWMNCSSSDCDRGPCNDGSNKGFCVKIPDRVARLMKNEINPQQYGPILWDPVACRWICRNGTYVMDWKQSDNYGGDNYPEGPVGPEDDRFDKTIYIPPSGPGGIGYYTPKYRFRGDRYVYNGCPDNSMRILEKDCECECLDCSGSYFDDNNDYGIPEAPPGYVFYDDKMIPIADTGDYYDPDGPHKTHTPDHPDPSGSPEIPGPDYECLHVSSDEVPGYLCMSKQEIKDYLTKQYPNYKLCITYVDQKEGCSDE